VGTSFAMPLFLALNILLGVIALSAILGLAVWAIRTQSADSIGRADERRQWHDRRQREAPDLPARAERRGGHRHEPEHRFGDTAAA
jgi:hypothetical protein